MRATVKRPLPDAPKPTKAVRIDNRQISESMIRKMCEMSEEQKKTTKERSHLDRHKSSWSEEELHEVKRLRAHGYTYKQISQSLGRTKQSVKSAVQRLLDRGEVERKVMVKK